jgi:hypothetical protein
MATNLADTRRTAIALLLAALASAAPAQAATTGNLVVNGDAELHRCTRDWTAQTPIAGWRVLRGAASTLCYAAFAVAGDAPALPRAAAAGKALFTAPGADTAMEQVVDLRAAAAAIDAGRTRYALSAWLGGWRDRPEQATLTAVFLDERHHAAGNPVVLAGADARARGGITRLVRQGRQGTVPAGTRQIVLTVHFLSAMTSYGNAYADNIRLELSGDVAGLHAPAAAPTRADVPPLDHVYVVMMENTNYADVVHTDGSGTAIDPGMPFLGSLARAGVILSNMWANYHPSDQNYVAMVAGDTYRYGPAYYPFALDANHLGDLLEARGRSWRAYVQHMNTPCNLASAPEGEGYAPDDQPFAQFLDVVRAPARCAASLRDLQDFQAAIASGALPDFAWIAADGWWNGEGAWFEKHEVAYSNARQDEFLRTTFAPLLQSPAWKTGRSLLVITWDESGGWGWPDNHVPTVLVGSPGLLREGTVVDRHYDGYSILRTVESGFDLGSLGRFDQYAEALDAVFARPRQGDQAADPELWPDPALASRGSLADTFGQAGTPAAVRQGQSVVLRASGTGDQDRVLSLAPLGAVPGVSDPAVHSDRDGASFSVPTAGLAPGVYGAWLRHEHEAADRAPLMLTVLAPSQLDSGRPGVEIVGAPDGAAHAAGVRLREGANLIVRYCRPAGAEAAATWIGVFPAGTPAGRMTQEQANVIGYALRTPGSPPGSACGETLAYAAELKPGQEYEILLLGAVAGSPPQAIGQRARFTLTPALPR